MIILKQYSAPEGFEVNLSILGHYNFYYPSKYIGFINKDTILEKISWIGFLGQVPFKVSANCIDSDAPQGRGDYSVVWIKSDRIHLLEE
tara:strand:- start:471 stop:737 length:267 start_codon:yes stop_codon:yes gene_type:complete